MSHEVKQVSANSTPATGDDKLIDDDNEPHGTMRDASFLSMEHSTLITEDTQSLAEGLYQADLCNHVITIIRAKNSGIAFLAATSIIQVAFNRAVRNVRSFAFASDLVTNDAFYWNQDCCVPCTAYDRRKALHTAITEGLLGKLFAGALDLEELHINFHMDKLQCPALLASELVHLVGDRRWQYLRRLELRGVMTTQAELSHLLYRHRQTLEVVLIADAVLRFGNWASFFDNLKSWVRHSRLTSENLHLDGNLHQQQDCSGRSCFVNLSSSSSDGRTLAQSLSDYLFGDDEHEIPPMFPMS